MTASPEVVVICGGVGAARMLRGMVQAVPGSSLVAIANVGDDMNLHGLHISPDIDTIIYTLSDSVSAERGWGLEGETWQAMEMLTKLGGQDWFSLGDRDLGTHLFRTQRLAEGAMLSEVTAELASGWDLDFSLLPVTNNPLRTMVTTHDFGEISFQEYFVGHQHSVSVSSIRFEGAEESAPAPGVLEALESARRIVVAPSNPVVSIDPVLAVPGVMDVLRNRRADVVAVSPIVGGKALKGPADRLLTELGREASVVGVAEWYADTIGTLIVDDLDKSLAPNVEALDMRCIVMPTVMNTPNRALNLALACL